MAEGRRATGVSCNWNKAAGTHMTSLTCLFDEEGVHHTYMDRDAQIRLWCADETATGYGAPAS